MCTLNNVEKSFTEIFSLLTPADNSSSSIEDLKTIYQHISNAIDIILRGFQELMDYFLLSEQTRKIAADLWSFFSLMTNLVEALSWFRGNVCYSLRQQEILDY